MWLSRFVKNVAFLRSSLLQEIQALLCVLCSWSLKSEQKLDFSAILDITDLAKPVQSFRFLVFPVESMVNLLFS